MTIVEAKFVYEYDPIQIMPVSGLVAVYRDCCKPGEECTHPVSALALFKVWEVERTEFLELSRKRVRNEVHALEPGPGRDPFSPAFETSNFVEVRGA